MRLSREFIIATCVVATGCCAVPNASAQQDGQPIPQPIRYAPAVASIEEKIKIKKVWRDGDQLLVHLAGWKKTGHELWVARNAPQQPATASDTAAFTITSRQVESQPAQNAAEFSPVKETWNLLCDETVRVVQFFGSNDPMTFCYTGAEWSFVEPQAPKLPVEPPPFVPANPKEIVKEYCFQCHSQGGDSKGGLDLSQLANANADAAKLEEIRKKMLNKVKNGDMPPKNAEKPLPQQRRETLLQFLQSDKASQH